MATFDQEVFNARMQTGETPANTRLVGYELEVARSDRDTSNWLDNAVNSIEGFASFGYDGDDIEVVTDPISTSLLIENSILHNVVDEIATYCETCFGGGTHINVSKLPKDCPYTYENLLWMQMIYEKQMQKIFGRISNWAKNPAKQMFHNTTRSIDKNKLVSSPLMKQLFDMTFDEKEMAEKFSKRNNKALLITDKGNRYEFRGGKSSIDEQELLAWGEFCVNCVNLASKPSIRNVKFKQLLVGPHIESYFQNVVQASDKRKIKDAELEETLRSTKNITIKEKNSCLL